MDVQYVQSLYNIELPKGKCSLLTVALHKFNRVVPRHGVAVCGWQARRE